MKNILSLWIMLNIVLLIIMANGKRSPAMQKQSLDPELAPYFLEFKREAMRYGTPVNGQHLTMSFSEIMPTSKVEGATVMGYCVREKHGQTVVIKRLTWDLSTVSERELIAFHELAHCLLNDEHNNINEDSIDYLTGQNSALVPSSIMNESMIETMTYESNRDTYLSRLFGLSNNMPIYNNAPSYYDSMSYDQK